MRLLTSLVFCTLVGLLIAAPTSDDDDKVLLTQSSYIEDLVKYKGQHDIVSLLVPLNSLNFDETDSSSSESSEIDTDIILFFAEADIQPDGSKVDQGLYVLKKDKATKILENGRVAAASGDESKLVFLGAADGLYVYNPTTNSADKYGSITDSIIGIAKEREGDVIYILTEDLVVYKVKDNGETKEKIEDIVGAKEIVLDYSNNIYFYCDHKDVHVRTVDGVKKIEGLPENPTSINLIKPPILIQDGVPAVVDNRVYVVYANGTSDVTEFEFKPKAKPTAYAPEAALIQYYAYDKKIYEYNLLALILSAALEELSEYISSKANDIRVLASKPKNKAFSNKT